MICTQERFSEDFVIFHVFLILRIKSCGRIVFLPLSSLHYEHLGTFVFLIERATPIRWALYNVCYACYRPILTPSYKL